MYEHTPTLSRLPKLTMAFTEYLVAARVCVLSLFSSSLSLFFVHIRSPLKCEENE